MNYKYILTAVLIVAVFSGTASAWLSGYDHRMAITVNNGEASPLSYYQFNFTNDTNTLVAAGHMQASGADCRVTDASDNLIPFWNETPFNAAGTLIWANATTLAVGDNTFYIYYGNAGASSVVNISTTFLFGDDFGPDTFLFSGDFGAWSKNRASYVVGDYVYAIHYQGLDIYNISDPANPIFVSTLNFGTYVVDIVVDGNYAYVSDSEEDKIYIIDVENPASMSVAGSVADATYLDFAHGIAKQGDYIMCCAVYTHGLTIVNVSNVSNPSVVGHLIDSTILNGIHDVAVDGNYAYVACHGLHPNGTVAVVDISDKTSPSMVDYVATSGLCHASDIQKKGDYCYTGSWPGCPNCGGSGAYIKVIDVSDVNNITVVGSLAGPRGYVLDIYGDYLYSANGEGVFTTYSFDVINISTPVSPSLHRRYSGIPCTAMRHVKITLDGKYAILADHVEVPSTGKFYTINLESGDWDDVAGTPTVSAGNLELKNSDAVRASGYSEQYCRCKCRAKKSSTSGGLARLGMSNTPVNGSFYADDAIMLYKYSTPDIKAGASNEGSLNASDINIDYAANIFQTFEFLWKNGEAKVYVDDVLGETCTIDIPDEALNPRLDAGVSGATEYVDWYFISKYTDIEPTSSLGAAEDAPSGGGAYNITLPLGWSIIGWTDTTDRTAHYMGGLIGGNCTYVTTRNSTTGAYESHNMAVESINNFAIERGWGYYVKTIAETLWERDT
jgi:hypothetical protein